MLKFNWKFWKKEDPYERYLKSTFAEIGYDYVAEKRKSDTVDSVSDQLSKLSYRDIERLKLIVESQYAAGKQVQKAEFEEAIRMLKELEESEIVNHPTPRYEIVKNQENEIERLKQELLKRELEELGWKST